MDAERCIYCNKIIPEGRMVCPTCERDTMKIGMILQSNNATKEEVQAAYNFYKGEKNMKKTLIVIDMQNDFIDGALGTKEAQAIVPNVKKKIKEYEARGDEIIFTRDTHTENYLETNEGKHLPVKHCIYGTNGWQIHNEVTPNIVLSSSSATIVNKHSFGKLDLFEAFDEYPDEIELVGLCTDICVVSNALILKATVPEIDITVDASCCAGVTPESHKAALTTMKMCQINVIGE